jgi:hypothetical protein
MTDAPKDNYVLHTELQDRTTETAGSGALVPAAPPGPPDSRALEVWETEGGAGSYAVCVLQRRDSIQHPLRLCE